MPIYEYGCPNCKESFTIIRPMSERKEETICPKCKVEAKRLISQFSSYSAFAPDSASVMKDQQDEKKWRSKRWGEDFKAKNPDPLKKWREERCKTLGVGPERWVQWVKEEDAKKKKKETYGNNWYGREL